MVIQFEFFGSDMLLGISFMDGVREDGEELKIFSIGIIILRIDFVS